MSKKMNVELALHEGRYGDLIRYLDQRIDILSQAVTRLVKANIKNSKKGGK